MIRLAKNVFYVFPLLLVGIFFIVSRIEAQTAAVQVDVKISVCGNNVKEGGEDCDGNHYGGFICANYGFDDGVLACNPDCSIDTSGCFDNPDTGGGNTGGGNTGGGGASGGASGPVSTTVNISGFAYPYRTVTVLKDGQVALTNQAGPDGRFSVSLTGLAGGNYTFSVYSVDINGNRSISFSFPVYITSGVITNISGIFLSPTVDVDKSEVKQGDDIAIFGQTVPNSQVTIRVRSDEPRYAQISADATGIFLHNFDTTPLNKGQHDTSAKTNMGADASSYGSLVSFLVGDKNVLKGDSSQNTNKSDINDDGKVNLVDFSIVAYWYKRSSPPANVDMNNDGKVDLIDLSIIAYYWTG